MGCAGFPTARVEAEAFWEARLAARRYLQAAKRVLDAVDLNKPIKLSVYLEVVGS